MGKNKLCLHIASSLSHTYSTRINNYISVPMYLQKVLNI